MYLASGGHEKKVELTDVRKDINETVSFFSTLFY